MSIDDFQFIFGQYSFYAQSFTRYLAGLMANLESDVHRAQLVENLWEESGETDPNQRHAELFRRFLTQGLGIALDELKPEPATQLFVNEVLSFCLRSPACSSAAFLALGTEGIVPQMYEIFVQGLQQAGVTDEHLTFFHLHIACDDNHAVTLENIMLSYASEPNWFATCHRVLALALDLREQFFTALYEQLQVRRIQPLLGKIQARQSLSNGDQTLRHQAGQSGAILYRNQSNQGKQTIDFTVERLTTPSEVLDPRLVRIAPNKTNERHRHAHEALLVIQQGQGTASIGQKQLEVNAGDIVFVPRWAAHQVKNTANKPLVMLAVTDFGLTSHAFIGHYLNTARLQVTQDADYAQ
ncbi:MAG: iron-containing redox enzyme family protein [Cyanobacteria bacterium P01_A01_bin.123]